MRRVAPAGLALLLAILTLGQTKLAPIKVRVVGITDGDTVRVLAPGNIALKVRLNGIDAPEKSQAFGEKSRQWLAAQVFNRDVTLVPEGRDRYGRTLGTLKIGGKDINLLSVRSGWAWWYRQYARGRLDLSAAEKNARDARRGLWSQGTPVAPWDYRRTPKAAKPLTPAKTTPRRRTETKRVPSKSTARDKAVYITETGHRYHSAGCGSLWHSKIKTTRKKAEAMGLTPCQRCGG